MATAKLNFINTVTIKELRKTIPLIGSYLTPVIQSEPGCGKTSLLTMLEEDLGDGYDYIYVDCPVKDMSDIGMVIPNHNTKTLEYYVASLFKMDSPKPKVICLDEFMKSPKMLTATLSLRRKFRRRHHQLQRPILRAIFADC